MWVWQESRSQGLDGLSKTWHVSGAQDTLLQWESGCHNLIQSPLNWNPSRTGIMPYLALHHQHTTCATVHSPDSSWSPPNISSTVNVHIIQVGGEENSFGVAAVDCLLIGIFAPSPAAHPPPPWPHAIISPQGHLTSGECTHQLWTSQLFIQELWVHFRCICKPDAAVGTQCVWWEIKTTEADAPLFVRCQKFNREEKEHNHCFLRNKDESCPKWRMGRALVLKCSFKWPLVCGGYRWRAEWEWRGF